MRELAELLTDNELTEIEVEDGDRRIKVSREPATVIGGAAVAACRRRCCRRSPRRRCTARKTSALPPQEEVAGEPVKSPMVGTAFLSPEPGAKPFIEVGDSGQGRRHAADRRGDEGDEPDHRARRRGTIKKIMVSDGQPVEFDQPLVVIG